MGTYYRIDNHDKKECISLSPSANIKQGAYIWGGCPSLQSAVLAFFLKPGSATGFAPDFRGRWELDRIRIHNDGEDDCEADTWPDAGMKFLSFLSSVGQLEIWLKSICWPYDIYEIARGVVEWEHENGLHP